MLSTKWLIMAAATAALAFSGAAARADGDAAKGEKVFAKCKACHDISEGKNKVGPTLKGLIGRTAGTVEGYSYSDANKNSGIVWGPETLKPYLADPKAVIPGTKMSFAGLKKEEDIENIIAYIVEASK